jgi:hypothetical protein
MAYIPDSELDALQRWCLNLADSALTLERTVQNLRQQPPPPAGGDEPEQTTNPPGDPNQALREAVNDGP